MIDRTNDEWLAALQSHGTEHDQALDDLRTILTVGLHRGLLGQVDTSAPEFDAQAEDFVQEALLKILDNLDSFAGLSKFTTWAHKITSHVALTELRRKRWQDASLDQITDRDDGEYTPTFTADPAPDPENATERMEMLRRVNAVIENGLTEKQSTAIKLSIIEGRSTTYVARTMQMKPNAVYKLLHDARLRLKQQLAEEGLTPDDILAAFE